MTKEELNYKIVEANKVYRLGNPTLADQEFDDLVEEYQKLCTKEEFDAFRATLNEGVIVVSDRKKIKHDFVAGSLDKLKYEEPSSVKAFIQKSIKTSMHISAKIDGLSGIAKYVDGKLVSLGTRGDGYIGEEHTEKANFIKCLPRTIPTKDTISIRGELVILKPDLKNVEGTAARNIVSGLIGRKEWNSRDISNITFVAYTILGQEFTKEEQFNLLGEFGFKTAWNKILTKNEIEKTESEEGIVEKLFTFATQDFEYETDGLVISDVNYKNEDEYRPDNQMAFKTNMQKFETRLLDIEWNGPSKDGVFVPVGILEPVECNGVVVSRCTLHNLDFIEEKSLKIGSRVWICRSGDVIPKLLSVIESDENCTGIESIKECPSCGSTLIRDGVNYRCMNKKCIAQTTFQVALFIRKFGVESANVKTLEKFNIHTIEDLLRFVPNKKYKSEVKLDNEIRSKVLTKSKRDLLVAMNFHGIGETIVGKIVDTFGYDNIDSNPEVVKNSRIDGIGDSFIQRFLDDIQENLNLVKKITNDYRYNFTETPGSVSGIKKEVIGSICFTGALSISRGEASKLAESAGYEVKGGVSKGLTYLVTNDVNSGSSKNKKAKQLGTKVIDEQEFMKLVSNVTNGIDDL